MTIEPTVRSSARSSKGRLFECQRSLTRMTSTVKVEGLRRGIVNRDESAWGDTKPKSSNRAKTAWLMARRGAPRGGFKPRPLGCSTVPAPERDQRCSDTSGTRGTTRPLAIRADRMVERGRRGSNMALDDKSRPNGRVGSSKGRLSDANDAG